MIYAILTIAIIVIAVIALKSRNHRIVFTLSMLISWMGGFCLNHVLTSLGVL